MLPTASRWPQASKVEQRQRGCATHRRAESALFVILSEAKDLPFGIRLWKTLRQTQGDKAALSLGRCFDKLSMTRPAQSDMFCHPERRAQARSRRIFPLVLPNDATREKAA